MERGKSTVRARASRLVAFRVLEVCAGFVFFWAVAHHVYTFSFRPLAAFTLPMLLVFFGFSSLLYMRGRSLAKGRSQRRSLYAAERAVQATVWYLCGIILGTSLYGLLVYFGIRFDPGAPSAAGFWLLLFLAPYGLMQAGFVVFMRAVWIVAPEFFRRVSPFEVRRRIEE